MTDRAELERVFALQQAHQWDVKASTAAERKAKLVDSRGQTRQRAWQIRLHFYRFRGMVRKVEWIRDYQRRRG